jgi:FtsP/CotA-like multicopper oxidase with cupredoxin domain
MRRARLGKTILIILAPVLVVALLGTLTLSQLARGSRWPDAINMGSDQHPAHGPARAGIASVTDLTLGPTNAPLRRYVLTAKVVKRPGLPDAWAYNGTVPGPELRVRQGDHVRVTLVNQLPVPTTIHWHGISVPNVADGPAGVTQDAVKPGQHYTYDFLANEPGTYWYHSHQQPFGQIPHGLLGALIVEPARAPTYDRDYTLVYHDHTPPARNLGTILGKILGNRDRNAIAVNGTNRDLTLAARPGELVRLRLINATASEVTAYGDPLRIIPLGMRYKVVALDGHDLNEPAEIASQALPIGSGQRFDLVFTMPASGIVRLLDKDQSDTVTIGAGQLTMPDLSTLPSFDLTRYGTPTPSPIGPGAAFDATHQVILGSKPGFHNGEFGLVHTINGKTFPETSMITVHPRQLVKLQLVNRTADEWHPMHIHGHTFTVLARNGKPLAGSPVRLDSVLMAPGEEWDVAFMADNPGLWMLHCHVLAHAATGMDVMVVYPNISTPFTIGRKSGNFPD